MLKTVFKQSNIFCFSEDEDEEMDIAGVNLQVFSVFQQCTMWYCHETLIVPPFRRRRLTFCLSQ